MRSALVQRWIDLSVAATSDENVAIPLIDESVGLLDLDEELDQIWRDDTQLHDDFVRALLENPSDLAVRFAALSAYYHLMEHKRALEEEDMLGILEAQREAFRQKLACLVGYQPVETCSDLRTIRWEIANSCAAKEYGRAFRLCDQLQQLLPDWNVSFVRGRLLFLVACLPSWPDPGGLAGWDSPIGPEPQPGFSEVFRSLGRAWIIRQLVSRELGNEVRDDAKAQFRKGIAELETASDQNPDIPLECHLILACSYAAVGQNHDAAQCFRRVLNHRDALLRYFEEDVKLPQNQMTSLESALFHRLVTAHQRAEEFDQAIGVAQDWIREFPKIGDAYAAMAQLHADRGDLEAAGYWCRKGEELIPNFGDDWKISLILKQYETRSPASLDQTIKDYADLHQGDILLIGFSLRRHWSAFKRLDEASKQKWATGIRAFNHGSPDFAVHAFAGVLERTLREFIFTTFRDNCRQNLGLLGNIGTPADDAKIFCAFLSGKADLAFGQMLIISKMSVRKDESPFGPFAGWLKGKRPSYFKGIGQLSVQPLIELRNRADHFQTKSITDADADKMLDGAKEIISLILEDASQTDPA